MLIEIPYIDDEDDGREVGEGRSQCIGCDVAGTIPYLERDDGIEGMSSNAHGRLEIESLLGGQVFE